MVASQARPGTMSEGTEASTTGQSQAPAAQADVLDTTAAGGRIIRGGAVRLLSYVAIVGLSVISAALLTRHLGTARFSLYTTVNSLVGIIAAISDVGMSTLGVQEFAVRRGQDREAMMAQLLGLRVTLTLVGVLFTVVFVTLAGYSPLLILGSALASLATVALVVQHTLTIPISAELRLGVLSALEVARQVIAVVAIVVLIALGSSLFLLLAVNLLAYALLVPFAAAAARKRIKLRMDLRPQHWMPLLRLTVSFSLATAVGTVYIYTAQIITSLVASPHQSGLFAMSFRVYIVAAAIPGLLVGGALPLLARAERDDRDRLAYALQRIFEMCLILGVATAIGLAAGANFIVHVVTGPDFSEYRGAVGAMRIQGFAMIASFLIAAAGYGLLALRRYRALLVVNGAAFAVSCVLTLLLAGRFGANGAAVATLGGEATLAAGCLLALSHGHPELRPQLSSLPRVAAAAAPAIALTFLLDLPSVALAALALCCYGVLIALTRAMPQEITDLVANRARARA